MPTLFITGANRGLGLALCKQYLEDDWIVHASCRDFSGASELKAVADIYTDKLTIHPLDVTDLTQIKGLKDKMGNLPIDVLFNNAGLFDSEHSAFGNINAEMWLKIMAVNVIAPMKMMESFVDNVAASDLKIMASMSSMMGSHAENTDGGLYLYRSSKAALNSVMVSAAIDLKEKGITSLMLHPGWVKTDMGGANAEWTVEDSARNLKRNINNCNINDTGSFLDIDGTIIPW